MSTKSVRDMSCGAMHEFALVLDKAGFDAELIQRVVNFRGNKLAKAMYDGLKSGVMLEDRFELVNTFGIVVPKGYDHKKRLDSFREEHRKAFHYYDDDINDQNFGHATTKLVPGQKLQVNVFQIKKTVTSEECLEYLRSQKAILVGAHGISLAWEQKKERMPLRQELLSFDKKKVLRKGPYGQRGVPYMEFAPAGYLDFRLGCFESNWSSGYCLCFCDE